MASVELTPVRALGCSPYSTTQLMRDRLGRQCVVKFLPRELLESNLAMVHREITTAWTLGSCHHPNVVDFFEVFSSDETHQLGVSMEYVPGELPTGVKNHSVVPVWSSTSLPIS
jgi:serine/threonine protein kinase